MSSDLVFMFSGQGSQYYQMGKELYKENRKFASLLDECSEMAQPLIGIRLTDILYDESKNKDQPFDNIVQSNVALLAMQYCLAKVLMEEGAKPQYLLGYSLGEFCACMLSGVISVEQGVDLVHKLGRVLQFNFDHEAMLAVIANKSLVEDEAELFSRCELAADNFEGNFVVSGKDADLATLRSDLVRFGVVSQRLPVNYAFHTHFIDRMQDSFYDVFDKLTFDSPKIPIVSAALGSEVKNVDVDYLWETIRRPVNFACAVRYLSKKQHFTFIDVGPSGTLATFVKYVAPYGGETRVYEAMNPYGKDCNTLARSLDSIVPDLVAV